MKIIYPDYSNCLVNLMASIRKYYNLDTHHKTLPQADALLAGKKYDNVIVILYDGMGSKIIDKTLKENCFLKSKKVSNFLSVFPSTTAAATTVVKTGLTPIETGWLGWHQYFYQYDKDLITFRGTGYYEKDLKITPIPSYELMPFKSLSEELNDIGVNAHEIFPSFATDMDHANNIRQFRRKIIRFTKDHTGPNFLYAYWDNPDHDLHKYGTDSLIIKLLMRSIDRNTKKVFKNVPENTAIFVIADHGHINVKHYNLFDYPDFVDTLKRLPSIDARNSTFFVKEGREKEFEELFDKYFGKDFQLFTKSEVYVKELFGDGQPHPLAGSFIGDYQAAAIGNMCFSYHDDGTKSHSKASHAGITEDEMLIPLIFIEK